MEKPIILIVDDEESIRKQLSWALQKDYNVLLAADKKTALNLADQEKPNVVALDLILSPEPGGEEEGLKVLRDIIEVDPDTKIIMITADSARDKALKAIELGAYDYYFKPINIEELKIIIKRALHIQSLERENKRLQHAIARKQRFEDMIGDCPQMQQIFATIKKIATTSTTVLIYGDTGTGKELVARAIHQRSLRANKHFVPINCGAIPETLLESELFGHEKGAFTDAYVQCKGKLEIANGGTVFLDEIGELSLSLQVKILRFLQDHIIERVGGREPIELDVRIIAATNKDLAQAIKKGTFREDLYYRLSVVTISLPPIKERGEDVILLAKYFLNKFAKENKKSVKGFSVQALNALKYHHWPGNVRELENRVHRAVIMTSNPFITPEDLGITYAEPPRQLSLKEAREQLEIDYIRTTLTRHRGNLSRVAEELDLSRPTLHDLIDKYQIDINDYK